MCPNCPAGGATTSQTAARRRYAFMLAFLLNRACETQIASQAGSIKPYVPAKT